ncbi:MAG TPA: hypothetical protein VF067_07555 [Sphingomicrobium sp.]
MFKFVVALAMAGAMSAPVLAQTQPNPAPAAQPQMVKKVICQRVDDEETTGSRLGSAPKVCKTVMVPAPKGGTANGQQAPAPTSPERGN